MRTPIDVVAGVIFKKGRILLHQRGKGDVLGGKWEFPGGKVESGETHEQALKREIMEEFRLKIKVKDKLAEVTHSYPHIYIRLIAYFALADDDKIVCSEGNFRWVFPQDIDSYPLSPADSKLWDEMKEEVKRRCKEATIF